MQLLSLCFIKLFSDWLLSIRDNGSHNIRKKSNIANRSKSHCERSHEICECKHANFKQRITCDFRIANEVEMVAIQSLINTKGAGNSSWLENCMGNLCEKLRRWCKNSSWSKKYPNIDYVDEFLSVLCNPFEVKPALYFCLVTVYLILAKIVLKKCIFGHAVGKRDVTG